MSLIPNLDEIEVSLFGPGYGECIVVHIGNNEWVIVDSCIEPTEKLPASIKYLSDIKINAETSVKTLIATHWHDDHVRGLSKTLEICRNAEFVCSGALQCKEFLMLTSAYSAKSSLSRGLKEFNHILSILEEREQPPKFAIADRCLLRSQKNQDLPQLEIYSLTPSDESIKISQMEIAKLLPINKELKKDIVSRDPNHSSVVTWFNIAGIHILLGADLFDMKSNYSGWNGVVNSSARPTGAASVYKVAHHGSHKSDNPSIWSKLLTDNPYALLTPFLNGRVNLPNTEDIRRICNYTNNAYITSPPKPAKIKREKIVKQFIKGATRSMTSLHSPFGQVQIRKKINAQNDWSVKLAGAAMSLHCQK
jgi:hypothetical protein